MLKKVKGVIVGVVAAFMGIPLMAGIVLAGATSLIFHITVAFPSLEATLQNILSLFVDFMWVETPLLMLLALAYTVCCVRKY